MSQAGGADFQNVGFNYGTGWHPSLGNGLLYELLDDGAVVFSGSASLSPSSPNYIGFSGGGFDTIRVRDNLFGNSSSLTDGAQQALVLDNIELQTVPEPSSIALLGICAFSIASRRRRRRSGQ